MKASRDAGSGQLFYLGYRGAIYLCGLTCLCRLGEAESDSAEVDLFILQAEQTSRTSGFGGKGGEWGHTQSWGWGRGRGRGRVLLDDLPDGRSVSDHSLAARPGAKRQSSWTNAAAALAGSGVLKSSWGLRSKS